MPEGFSIRRIKKWERSGFPYKMGLTVETVLAISSAHTRLMVKSLVKIVLR
jgi:hypothetical protein